jgi:hypothetical protein
MGHWWNDIERRKSKCSEESLFQWHLFHHTSHMKWPLRTQVSAMRGLLCFIRVYRYIIKFVTHKEGSVLPLEILVGERYVGKQLLFIVRIMRNKFMHSVENMWNT